MGYKIEEGSKIFKTGEVEDLTVKLGRSVKKKLLGSQIRSQFNESRHLYTLNDRRITSKGRP